MAPEAPRGRASGRCRLPRFHGENIPSYRVRVGETVAVRPKSQKSKFWEEAIVPRFQKYQVPNWLTLDANALSGKVIALPDEEDIPQNFNRKMIIEFYSR